MKNRKNNHEAFLTSVADEIITGSFSRELKKKKKKESEI